jgi:hypothetical protein
MPVLAAACGIGFADLACAVGVFRCVDAAGQTEYRDSPCDAGVRADVVNIEPNAVSEMNQGATRAANAMLSARIAARVRAEAAHDAAIASLARPTEPVVESPEPDVYWYAPAYTTSRREASHHRAQVRDRRRGGNGEPEHNVAPRPHPLRTR